MASRYSGLREVARDFIPTVNMEWRRPAVLATVCVVLFVNILLSSGSVNSREHHVEYTVAGKQDHIYTVIRSLHESVSVRVKRLAQSGPSVEPSSSASPASTQAPTPSTQAPTPSTQTPAPSTQAPAPSTQAPAPSTQAPAPSTQGPTTTQKPATIQRPTTTQRPATAQGPTATQEVTTTPVVSQPPQTAAPGSDNSTETPRVVEDEHDYYSSMIMPGQASSEFIELDNPQTHSAFSSGHRIAVTIDLPFPFRFYGHNITTVTVATGGFIYMSPFRHRYLAATQYIAPLMANFHNAASNDSNIFYQRVGDEFVVEWHEVMLKDREDRGSFTFQTKLKSDGTITFVYKKLPLPVKELSTDTETVKIGLSDAFYNDTTISPGTTQRTIYEYHRVHFDQEQVDEGTVIVMEPLPTCNIIKDCETCAEHVGVNFNCKWCAQVQRCSDGLDWYRQNWNSQGCGSSAHADVTQCHPTTTSTTLTTKTAESSTPQHISLPAHSPTQPQTQTLPTSMPSHAPTSKSHTQTQVPTTQKAPTQAPTSQTAPTQAPTSPTQVPTSPTQAPTSPTQAPTQAPTNLTQAPTSLTQAPTQAPTSLTQAPTSEVANSSMVDCRSHADKTMCGREFDTTTATNTATTVSSPSPVSTQSTSSATYSPGPDCTKSRDSSCTSSPAQSVRRTGKGGSDSGMAAVIAVVVILVVVLCMIGVWVYYAYTHPTSSSGMWLMEHRPSQLRAKLSRAFGKKETSSKYAMESTA